MTKNVFKPVGLMVKFALCLAIALPMPSALANNSSTSSASNLRDCEHILGRSPTLPELIHDAQKLQNEMRKDLPLRTFVDPLIDKERVERTGVAGPKALMELNPPRMEFQGLQAPFPETAAVVKLDSPGKSIVLRKRTNFNGQSIPTSVYASIPTRVKKFEDTTPGTFKRRYLIGPEHKDTGVIFWMHGGGTPTATGVNAMSVGLEQAKRNIPVVAIDGPGHGNSAIYPFKSGREMMEYYLEIMRDLIHPDVPIIPMGHSWGGQFAIQMNLMWPTLNTKNLNVVGFLSLSPPADLSLGGSGTEKQAADAKVDACFKDWAGRVAPGDYDFINNIVRNGKTSPVAGMFCTISALDYSWKLPAANEPARPRLSVIVGENDGLVYSGRESIFKKFLTELVGPKNLVIMGPGRTFKGDNVPTGHNVFDRYIDAAARAELGDFLGSEKDKKDIAEVYARISHFVSQQVGQELPKLGGEDADNSAGGILDKYYRHYSNNLAFREFVKSYVYREFRQTDHAVQMRDRRILLDAYLKEAEELRAKAVSQAEAKIQLSLEALAAKWKVRSVLFARKEIPIVADTARSNNLRAFLQVAVPIRDRVVAENPDNSAQLIRELKSLPKGISSLKEASDELSKGPKDKARRRELETFVLNARTIENQYKKDLGSKIGTALDLSVKYPENIKSIADAQWELGLDTSEKRKQDLKAYLAEVAQIEASREEQVQAAAKTALAVLPVPAATANHAQALAEANRLRLIIDARYVPEVESGAPQSAEAASKAGRLVARMNDTAEAINQVGSQLKALSVQLAQAKSMRMNLLKAYETAVATILDLNRTPVTEHKELNALVEIREKALEVYTQANRNYDLFVNQRLAAAYDRGELTNDFVKTLFTEVHMYVDNYSRARARFLQASRQVDDLVLKLAREGEFGPELKKTVTTLYGADGRGGVEHQLSAHIHTRDSLLKVLSNSQAEAHALRKKYNEIVPGFYTLFEQDLYSLLSMPYDNLVNLLEDKEQGKLARETLRSGLSEFENMWQGRDTPDKKGAEIN